MNKLYQLNTKADAQLLLDEMLASLGKLEAMAAMLSLDEGHALNPRLVGVYLTTMHGFIHDAQSLGKVLYKKIATEIWHD
jgi:hypothetical protein